MVSISFLAIALQFLFTLTAGQSPSSVSTDLISSLPATIACKLLDALLGPVIILPADSQYTVLSDINWSQTAWKHPSCIAQPKTVSDLQKIVTTLTVGNIPFAIRSGGHSPNPFDANIDTGVLISMDQFNTVTYDAAKGTASFGPGNRWQAVYDVLDPHNVTVVGGRVLDVGVGGLMVGSGLSYLSDLYGMACDNVVSFDVSTILYNVFEYQTRS